MLQWRSELLNDGNYCKCCIRAQCPSYDRAWWVRLSVTSAKSCGFPNEVSPNDSNVYPCWRQQYSLDLMGQTKGQVKGLMLMGSVQDPHVLFYLLWANTNVFLLTYKRHLQTFPALLSSCHVACNFFHLIISYLAASHPLSLSVLFSQLILSHLRSPHLLLFCRFSSHTLCSALYQCFLNISYLISL